MPAQILRVYYMSAFCDEEVFPRRRLIFPLKSSRMKTFFLSLTLLVAISVQAQLPTASPKAAGFDLAREFAGRGI